MLSASVQFGSVRSERMDGTWKMSVGAGVSRGVNQVLKDLITASDADAHTHTRRLQVHSLDWVKRGGGENQLDCPKSRRRRATFLSPSVSQSSLSLEASQLTATAAVCLVIWRSWESEGRKEGAGKRERGAAKMSH